MREREPAEVFCLAEFLADEMQARDWTTTDVALRMGARDEYGINKLKLDLLMAINSDENLIIDDETFVGLARAFSVSEEFFRNLDATWRKWPDRRTPFECPEELFGD